MSATVLLDQAVARVRNKFTRQEVATVEPYGGEFSAAEIPHKSYSCPAIFVTVLGWQPATDNKRLTGKHVSRVRLAAFVVYKHATRTGRMAGAMLLAERLAICMRQWEPMRELANANLPVTIAGLEEEPTCENLYSRALDEDGQALFLVDWFQCVAPAVPMEQMWELLSIDILDKTRAGTVPAAPPATGTVPVVAEQVDFVQQTN